MRFLVWLRRHVGQRRAGVRWVRLGQVEREGEREREREGREGPFDSIRLRPPFDYNPKINPIQSQDYSIQKSTSSRPPDAKVSFIFSTPRRQTTYRPTDLADLAEKHRQTIEEERPPTTNEFVTATLPKRGIEWTIVLRMIVSDLKNRKKKRKKKHQKKKQPAGQEEAEEGLGVVRSD